MDDEDHREVDPKDGKVRQVCQTWQILEDEGLAYRLQNEEINVHYDRNRQNSRLVRDDFKAARREQSTEQELLECTRRQEEAEAEELAAQLALLLDEERKEEDAIFLDEQLARKLAQEDDEAIAREQQDRELARMLQAKERLKAKKLREARRRREEAAAAAAAEAGRSRDDEEEVIYANLAGPFQTQAISYSLTHEYATVSKQQQQQQQQQQTGSRSSNPSEPFGQSSIYLLRNADILNPSTSVTITNQHNTFAPDVPFRGATAERATHTNSGGGGTGKCERNDMINGQGNEGLSGQRNQPRARLVLEEHEGLVPPYMPMQGLSLGTSGRVPPSSTNADSTPKKNASCKTQ